MVKYDSTNGYYLTRVCDGNESENAELHSVNMIFSKYIFDHLFHWKGIYYGQMYPKTCFWILISPPEPKKTTKKGYFWKIKNYSFLVKFGDFKQKCGQKLCIMMYLSSMQFMHMVPVTFGYFFSQIFQKWPIFG